MKTTETIKCPCGESFQWEPSDWMETQADLDLYRPTSCPPCIKRQDAEYEASQKAEALREKIEKARKKALGELPCLFHATDTNHPRFNRPAWEKVKDHKLTEEKPWLGLIGETGLSKTRIAALIAIEEVRQLTERWTGWGGENLSFVFVTGYRICELAGIVQTGSFDQKEEARKELEQITTCDLLLIDDLGKGRVNDSVAATLFGLMDYRYANILRTIWTANSTPEQIAASMTSDMAAPFAGRLNDHSRIIKLRSKP
jgi:DNA replication protein DnaC